MQATIHPSASFDEQRAAESLDRAMRGYGTDKQRVIDILVRCNNAQRQMLRTPYKVRYGRDLETELKRELSGDLEDVIIALMQTPTKRDVMDLHRAVKGLGTNEGVLIEILASRTNEEIQAIRNTYYTTFDRPLEDAVSSDTSGDFRRLLMILIQGNRDESSIGEYHKAVQEAHNILRCSDKRGQMDKLDAYKVLATSNSNHVGYLISEFENVAGYPIEKAIEKDFSGNTRDLLLVSIDPLPLALCSLDHRLDLIIVHIILCSSGGPQLKICEILLTMTFRRSRTLNFGQALVMVAQSKPKYFAHQIHNATKGIGTRDRDLIRVLVSRAEIDLAAIQVEYERLFRKPLVQVIREEAKGAYRDALISIVKGNRSHTYIN
ncbi:Annexin [Necator americanus]|uniref:Annexin n=1 Tax=Necator americanus TaxID=51031 RepID=W2TDT8_NECAM|nr:Annexin [Necator americanus]ETN79749.1 Annexin [Necator americanus]